MCSTAGNTPYLWGRLSNRMQGAGSDIGAFHDSYHRPTDIRLYSASCTNIPWCILDEDDDDDDDSHAGSSTNHAGVLVYVVEMAALLYWASTDLLQDQTSRERVIQSLASMSSSQIVSATALHHKSLKASAASAAAAAASSRPSVDSLRHSNYHSHNGFTTVWSQPLSTRLWFSCFTVHCHGSLSSGNWVPLKSSVAPGRTNDQNFACSPETCSMWRGW